MISYFSPTQIRRDFKAQYESENHIRTFKDGWESYVERVKKLATMESSSRPVVRELLEKLAEEEAELTQGWLSLSVILKLYR